SIADSNIWFWAQAIAAERGLKVRVSEPDVSPLAIQGPKAIDVAEALFGDWVRKLRYFWFRETSLQGIPVVLARSGWSKQGGYEIYLMDGTRGTELWNLVKEAGRPWDIGPGNPNLCERIESGLLSYGGDSDKATNPFEVRLGAYVDLDVEDDVVGIAALRKIKADGVQRQQLGVVLEGDVPAEHGFHWHGIEIDGQQVGSLTNGVWSYRMQRNIGFGLVSSRCKPGDKVTVRKQVQGIPAQLVELPFL
ncbi:MAG: glycine cleavage T C-terminal barrel domain-containing protein, partial [Burkholderiaceae bacterium]